jgi:xanthine/CO dehydrogenase XdhC/CoxF family maturation factor
MLDFLDRETAAGHRLVAAFVIATEGSTYRKPGASMLLSSSGLRCGLLSGGCLEGDLHEHAQHLLAGDARILERRYDGRSSDDPIWGLGLGCEGAMRILLWRLDAGSSLTLLRGWLSAEARREPALLEIDLASGDGALSLGSALCGDADGASPSGMLSPGRAMLRDGSFAVAAARVPALLLCGAGPDAEPVVRIAALLGWQVTVIDHRPAYVEAARFPGARRVAQVDAADPGAVAPLDGFDAAVVMSHNLVADGRYLAALATSAIPYVGLLGPAARRERLAAELGPLAEALRPRLRAPVGLDLGGGTPEAIALAIVAEIQAALHSRPATSFGQPLTSR